MRSTMIEDRITDPLDFPLALDKLLGKEKAFKVKWQSQWDNYSVISILEDDDILKQLKESCRMDVVQLIDLPLTPLLQIKESVEEANVMDDSEVITVCD
ncbi:hypothetical protein RYX36_009223 [Vicia faba]